MKTQRTIQLLMTLLAVLTLQPARAQEWSFGPKLNGGISARRTIGDQVQIGSNRISILGGSESIGGSAGAFLRYDRPRWYGQVEATQGKYSLTQALMSGPGSGFSVYPRGLRTDIHLIGGIKPLPWLRVNLGLTGTLNHWKTSDNTSSIQAYQESIQKYPSQQEYYTRLIEKLTIEDALLNSYKRTTLEGQLGIGTDIGGLTIDLTYAHSLTPIIDGISFQNQTYALRQYYSYWSLGLGYKLVPLKRHLLAPRKTRAYERIRQDIPFYRNEFHVAVGLLGEDIGSQLIYENRYTRYLTRQFGLTAGLSFSHTFTNADDRYSSSPLENQVTLLAGVRLLPLYSRRHTIGFTAGLLLTYLDEIRVNGGGLQVLNGQEVRYLNLTRNAAVHHITAGWHSSLDYQFALTDRLIAGPWLRVLGHSFIVPDYANFGIQAGYRF